MSDRLGLYGGSFNPIHHGHLIAARAMAEQLGLRQVILIPSAEPPHKRGGDLESAADRLEMTRLAVAGDPLFAVSDVELRRDGPSYTLDTVVQLQAELGPSARFCWIIGADSLPELASWSRIERLVEAVEIVTAARPGFRPETLDLSALRSKIGAASTDRLVQACRETPEIGISASDIRRRVRAGTSIRYLVPEAVERFVRERGLYR
ncbi:MAG: nicotinate-nucleotide adenylyltransferase [Phycisphaerae bacterium]